MPASLFSTYFQFCKQFRSRHVALILQVCLAAGDTENSERRLVLPSRRSCAGRGAGVLGEWTAMAEVRVVCAEIADGLILSPWRGITGLHRSLLAGT